MLTGLGKKLWIAWICLHTAICSDKNLWIVWNSGNSQVCI